MSDRKLLKRNKKLAQPIKWHGGKNYLADWIVGHMPPHLHYVEPFFGGGAVLLARDPTRDWMSTNGEKLPAHLRGCSEVINDLDGELMNFWRVLQSDEDFAGFRRVIESIPFSAVEFQEANAKTTSSSDRVQQAVAFFIRARQSRQGLRKDFATLSQTRTRRGMNEQVSAYLTAIEGLAEVHERLKRVVILKDDACKVIRRQDGPYSLFYLDPPYLHQTRVTTADYAFEMSTKDHEKLLQTLSTIEGKFMLSGYPSQLYEEYAQKLRWRCEQRVIDNKASSKKTKEKKTECLWMNFPARNLGS